MDAKNQVIITMLTGTVGVFSASQLLLVSLPHLQRPNNAKTANFGATTASVYQNLLSATRTMTVPMAQTRLPAPNLLAAATPSSATTRCAYWPSGAAMEKQIVLMGPMNGRRSAGHSAKTPAVAAPMSFSVPTGSASAAAGSATETWTVRTGRMKSTAVSGLFRNIKSLLNPAPFTDLLFL